MSRIASVHWNLQRLTYSIKVSGQPVTYAPQVHMRDCVFHIDKRLRAAFEARPSRRTVHALIRGVVVDTDLHESQHGERVRCNPFQFAFFCRASDGVRAISAAEVILHPDRTIEAIGLIVDERTPIA